MDIDDFSKENIIDLRKKDKFLKYHFNGSLNIDYIKLLGNPSLYLEKNKKYLLICDKGIQSMDVSKILNKKGFHTYSLNGGIEKYKKTKF